MSEGRSRNRTECSSRGRLFSISVGVSPTLLLDIRNERLDVFIYNNSGQSIAIGFTADAIFFPLATGEYKTYDSYLGELYGITDTSPADIIVEEVG